MKPFRGILKDANPEIASATEQPAHFFSLVAMVNKKSLLRDNFTNGARASLFFQKHLIIFFEHPILTF